MSAQMSCKLSKEVSKTSKLSTQLNLYNYKFLRVVFNLMEKHGPLFLSLDFALRYNVCKKNPHFLAASSGVYLLSSQCVTAKIFFFSCSTNSKMMISHQRANAKILISLRKQRNVDMIKEVDFLSKTTKC